MLFLVRSGNYYPCSWNPCNPNNDDPPTGQCIAMYPSPNLEAYVHPVASRQKSIQEDLNDSKENDIFIISPQYSRWEDASEYCVANDAALLEISINSSISR